MKIAVLGTGSVGQTLGKRLAELGHHVIMGSRTKDNEKAMSFSAANPGKAEHSDYAGAASQAEMIINCTKGEASVAALKMAGENNLKHKVILDLSNPLDFSKGMPPSLIPELSNTHSLGEEIQRSFPDSKVVKTLNTM